MGDNNTGIIFMRNSELARVSDVANQIISLSTEDTLPVTTIDAAFTAASISAYHKVVDTYEIPLSDWAIFDNSARWTVVGRINSSGPGTAAFFPTNDITIYSNGQAITNNGTSLYILINIMETPDNNKGILYLKSLLNINTTINRLREIQNFDIVNNVAAINSALSDGPAFELQPGSYELPSTLPLSTSEISYYSVYATLRSVNKKNVTVNIVERPEQLIYSSIIDNTDGTSLYILVDFNTEIIEGNQSLMILSDKAKVDSVIAILRNSTTIFPTDAGQNPGAQDRFRTILTDADPLAFYWAHSGYTPLRPENSPNIFETYSNWQVYKGLTTRVVSGVRVINNILYNSRAITTSGLIGETPNAGVPSTVSGYASGSMLFLTPAPDDTVACILFLDSSIDASSVVSAIVAQTAAKPSNPEFISGLTALTGKTINNNYYITTPNSNPPYANYIIPSDGTAPLFNNNRYWYIHSTISSIISSVYTQTSTFYPPTFNSTYYKNNTILPGDGSSLYVLVPVEPSAIQTENNTGLLFLNTIANASAFVTAISSVTSTLPSDATTVRSILTTILGTITEGTNYYLQTAAVQSTANNLQIPNSQTGIFATPKWCVYSVVSSIGAGLFHKGVTAQLNTSPPMIDRGGVVDSATTNFYILVPSSEFYDNNTGILFIDDLVKARTLIQSLTGANKSNKPANGSNLRSILNGTGYNLVEDTNYYFNPDSYLIPINRTNALFIKYRTWASIAHLTSLIDTVNRSIRTVSSTSFTYTAQSPFYSNGSSGPVTPYQALFILIPTSILTSLIFFTNSADQLRFKNAVLSGTSDFIGDGLISEALGLTTSPYCLVPKTTFIPASAAAAPSSAVGEEAIFTTTTNWIISGQLKINDDETFATLEKPDGLATVSFANGVDVTRNQRVETLRPGNTLFLLIPAGIPVCFLEGALVETDQGIVPIERIDPLINTINGKRIIALTADRNADAKLITLRKGSLGPNVPDRDTDITPWHKVLYNGEFRLAGQIPTLQYRPYKGEILYNVLMSDHDTMVVNNMICKTLPPDHPSAAKYMF